MKVLYHIPSLNSIYANRTIYNGYKNAFKDLGHEFFSFTADDDLDATLERVNADIFITATHFYYKKFLDFDVLDKHRKKGLFVLTKIDFWNSPIAKSRVNEAKSLSQDFDTVALIKEGKYGDAFYHVLEQDDERMKGFHEGTGYPFYTIPLAADKIILKDVSDSDFKTDISYLGTYLPAKRKFFEEYVFPLGKKFDLKLYGQDWTPKDRMMGWVARVGQYFNLPYLRSIQKPKLKLEDEGKIYASSTVSINVHEDYQKKYGGDCNERTFKIPICGGFEITDDVKCIHKYFEVGKEIIVASTKEDWFEKIEYYIKHPEERIPIIEAGKKRVLSDHTYHNRVEQICRIYEQSRIIT